MFCLHSFSQQDLDRQPHKVLDSRQRDPPPDSTVLPEPSSGPDQGRPTQDARTTQMPQTRALTAKEQKQEGVQEKVVSEDTGKTWTSTEAPTLRPQARPTEPPFIGDVYASEHVPPQTVGFTPGSFKSSPYANANANGCWVHRLDLDAGATSPVDPGLGPVWVTPHQQRVLV